MNIPYTNAQLAGRWDEIGNCAQTQGYLAQNNSGNIMSWPKGQLGGGTNRRHELESGLKFASKHAVILSHFSANSLEGGIILYKETGTYSVCRRNNVGFCNLCAQQPQWS